MVRHRSAFLRSASRVSSWWRRSRTRSDASPHTCADASHAVEEVACVNSCSPEWSVLATFVECAVKEGGELSAALQAEQPYPTSGHRVRDLLPLRFIRGNDARPPGLGNGDWASCRNFVNCVLASLNCLHHLPPSGHAPASRTKGQQAALVRVVDRVCDFAGRIETALDAGGVNFSAWVSDGLLGSIVPVPPMHAAGVGGLEMSAQFDAIGCLSDEVRAIVGNPQTLVCGSTRALSRVPHTDRKDEHERVQLVAKQLASGKLVTLRPKGGRVFTVPKPGKSSYWEVWHATSFTGLTKNRLGHATWPRPRPSRTSRTRRQVLDNCAVGLHVRPLALTCCCLQVSCPKILCAVP